MTYKRTDRNQVELVQYLRRLGASVLDIHSIGKGAPDIVIGYQGFSVLAEIKDGSKPPSARRLTEDEERFFKEWRGSCYMLESFEHCHALLDVLDKMRVDLNKLEKHAKI